MEALKLSLSQARKLFPKSPDWFQEILKNTFGIKAFSSSIIERIDPTFEAFYEEASENIRKEYNELKSGSIHDIARKKLELIAAVLREGIVLDYSDYNQKKWSPVFDLSSGCRFHASAYLYSYASSHFGPRLSVNTQDKSNFFGNNFNELWSDYLIIKQ